MVELDKDVKYIKGVGPNRVQLLNKLNINTLEDLITYFPRTYEDRSIPKKIYECIDGDGYSQKRTSCIARFLSGAYTEKRNISGERVR